MPPASRTHSKRRAHVLPTRPRISPKKGRGRELISYSLRHAFPLYRLTACLIDRVKPRFAFRLDPIALRRSTVGVILNETSMKFHKKKARASESKKAHTSPMQKKGWAKQMSLEEAQEHLTTHVRKGAAWSENTALYLNALWSAVLEVAKEEGFESEE